jgi:hypothetical protein
MDSEGRNAASPAADAAPATASSESTAPGAPPPEQRDERATEDVIRTLYLRLGELFDYAAYYLLTRIDAGKHYLKRKILWLSIVALTVLACAGATVTAVVLLCAGVADGLSDLLGHRWAGELLTGVLLLAVTAGAGYWLMNHLVGQSKRERMMKFEKMRARHRQRYGHDIADAARQASTENPHG